jgi:hypothetical protein
LVPYRSTRVCYYKGNSGIPWEDSNSTGGNPTVADAVVLSYVSNDSQFSANTVSNYNNYDSLMGCTSANMCGNSDIGISVGGDTYLPSGFPIFMYEYGWTSGSSIPPKSGPGYSSGYYVGILQYNDTIGYFLTTEYTNNPNPNNHYQYYDYYYSGSGWSTSYSLKCLLGCPTL